MSSAKRALSLAVVLVLSLCMAAGVEAQEDKWSFVFTPQLWMANIAENGFAPPGRIGSTPFAATAVVQGVPRNLAVTISEQSIDRGDSDPGSIFYPQWGGQLAAQYRRWTIAVGAQYVSFTTTTPLIRNDSPGPFTCQFTSPGPGTPPFVPFSCNVLFGTVNTGAGANIGTEKVRTDRTDVDLILSYFVPDVVKDVLDVSIGAGFKWIRASGQRELINTPGTVFPPLGVSNTLAPLQYIYADGRMSNSASFLDNFYGLTIPTSLSFQLTRDKKWLLPVTMVPFLGYERQDDQVNGLKTAFAYGGTFDAGVRYVFDNGVALYAGYRAQVIQGVERYFAQGPLFNMSVRFGGR
jgi:hypothetical protein